MSRTEKIKKINILVEVITSTIFYYKEGFVKKRKVLLAIIALLIVTATTCGYYFLLDYNAAQEEISVYTHIQAKYSSTTNIPIHEADGDDSAQDLEEIPEAHLLYVEVDYEALLLMNSDTVGWIAVPDTVINYPVVQATNNTKYLDISFEGKRSGTGTPFADYRNDMENLDANIIIYAHNMGAGRSDMFGTLLMYKEHEHYATHRYIQFDTIYQRLGWWKVVAVIELDTRNTDFQYQHIYFQDEAEFMDWVAKVMMLSIHDTDMSISPNDNILILSTCDRSKYGRYGRFLILAVRTSGHFVPKLEQAQ